MATSRWSCTFFFFSRGSGRRIFMNETHPRRAAGAGTVGTLRFHHTAELIHSHPRSGAALIARHAAARRQCGGSSCRRRSSLLQLTVHPDIRVKRKKGDCCTELRKMNLYACQRCNSGGGETRCRVRSPMWACTGW